MTVIEALILGIVQGLTEFLPVSSSGHLELGTAFLNTSSGENLLFSVMVHFATTLSTLVIYRKDISTILKDLLRFEKNESTEFTFKILISMIPVLIVGLFFKEEVETFFTGNVKFVAWMLLITGLLLLLSSLVKSKDRKVTYANSFIIGIAQAFAVLPGISRSGATISTALLLGTDREKATRFSFLMVLIPIIGASLLEILEILQNPALGEGLPVSTLIIGFLAAFISGLVACKWMIRIVNKGRLIYFAVYVFIIASVILLN